MLKALLKDVNMFLYGTKNWPLPLILENASPLIYYNPQWKMALEEEYRFKMEQGWPQGSNAPFEVETEGTDVHRINNELELKIREINQEFHLGGLSGVKRAVFGRPASAEDMDKYGITRLVRWGGSEFKPEEVLDVIDVLLDSKGSILEKFKNLKFVSKDDETYKKWTEAILNRYGIRIEDFKWGYVVPEDHNKKLIAEKENMKSDADFIRKEFRIPISFGSYVKSVAKRVWGSNRAMQVNVRGGIDLNTSNGMQWNDTKEGSGVEMNIDSAMIAHIRREGINSLSPDIFKVTHVTSIWPLVGFQAPAVK